MKIREVQQYFSLLITHYSLLSYKEDRVVRKEKRPGSMDKDQGRKMS